MEEESGLDDAVDRAANAAAEKAHRNRHDR